MEGLQLIKPAYWGQYEEQQPITLLKHFNKIKKIGMDPDKFDFYISSSAVFSSMIEGNMIDFDSYLRYTHSGMNNKGKSFTEIEDLKAAYHYAKTHTLNQTHFMAAHKLLSKTIIADFRYRGKMRDKEVFVFKSGVKIFTGPGPDMLQAEMGRFFADIALLLDKEMSITEAFYYAAMIHLVFVQIHPFADGNGRASRLLEKWFLAQKIGFDAWFVQSERLYHKRETSYYKNVHIGNDYASVDYDLSLPFLLMLPMALRIK